MRVLVTGMGGQLGTLVAQRLESLDSVEQVAGYDLDPPRRRLRRATFERISPRAGDRVAAFIEAFDPNVVIHLGIYEPHARLTPPSAQLATTVGTAALAEALRNLQGLQTVVVRSGIEVYGRRRGGPLVPDEDIAPDPTTEFGRAQLEVEQTMASIGSGRDVNVSLLRFAPIMGSHTPSPLGRILRLGAMPVPALGEPTFTMVHAEDATEAVVAAAQRGVQGPLNVVAPGSVSAYQAARLGGRLPVPVVGPGWRAATWLTEMAGAPLPDHVRESLERGRCADGSRCAGMLGFAPWRGAVQILAEVHEFATVEYLPVAHEDAA